MKRQLLFIQFLFYAAGGLFAPSWYRILIGQGESPSQFGILLGLAAFGSIGSAYFAGWLSNRWTTSKILASTMLAQGIVMLFYLPNFGILSLSLLQITFGMLSAAALTLQQIIVAKTTKGEDKSIGLYNSAVQAAVAITMVSSGFLSLFMGDVGVIVLSFILLLVSSILSWKLK